MDFSLFHVKMLFLSVFTEFNIYIMYRMRNNFKLVYDITHNLIEYLMILVIAIHIISSNVFSIHIIPLIAITSKLLITFFYHFTIYFLLETVPSTSLIYQLIMKK